MDGCPTSCLSNMKCTNALMDVSLSVPLSARRSSGARGGDPKSGGDDGVGVSAGLTPLTTGSAAGGDVYLEQPVSVCAGDPRCDCDVRLCRVVRAALSAFGGGGSIMECSDDGSRCVCGGVAGAA